MPYAPVTDRSLVAPTQLRRRLVPVGCCSALLLAMAMSPAVAADMLVSDLRLNFGILSDEFRGPSSTTATDFRNRITTSSSSSDSRNADDHYRIQLHYVRGRLGIGGGFIWGIGAAVNHATWDNGAIKAHATTPMVNVRLGYGYAVLPYWHFELTPFGSYGQTFYSVSTDDSSSTQKKREHYIEYGASLGTFVALPMGLVFGLEVPYLVGRFEPDYSYTSNDGRVVTVSDKRRNKGFGILGSIGFRF